jgi:ankyrin repeat protein
MGYLATKGEPRLAGKENDHMILDTSAGMKRMSSCELHYSLLSQQIRDGAYPLHMAIGAPLNILELLVLEAPEIRMETNKYGETPLHLALKQLSHEATIQLLLREEALHMRDAHGRLPIHVLASKGGSVQVAKDLLELWPAQIQEQVDGKTPLELAVQYGQCSPEVVRLLQMTNDSL